MLFTVLKDSDGELCFVTGARARRGRGLLYALAPWLVYLLGLSILFAVAFAHPPALAWTKTAAALGSGAAVALTPIGYALGYRARDQVETQRSSIRVLRIPSLGPSRLTSIAVAQLTALAIDPSIRSLGADLLLVAVHRDGRRIAIAEGEPHLGQLRQLASRAAQITGLPLESPRFTQTDPARALGESRSQAKQ